MARRYDTANSDSPNATRLRTKANEILVRRFAAVAVAASIFLALVAAGCSNGAETGREPATTPGAGSVPTGEPAPADTQLPDGRIRHVVAPGESLVALAETYDVTVEAIVEENYGIKDPPQSVLDFFERLHAGEGCMFAVGAVMFIPAPVDAAQ